MIQQEGEMIGGDDWLGCDEKKSMYQKYLPPPLTSTLSLMGPSSVSVAEGSDDSDAFSFVDGYLTDLPTGMFNPKLTLGEYAIGGGCPQVAK